jgi:single-strand DNA-binding protein
MKSINRVTLIGAVGQDPETRFSAAGMAIASFSLATSEKRKDKEEVTQWHSCVAFGKLAEIVQQYVTKGSKLYLDGAIQYQTYEKDGEKRYATKIVVNDISMLSPASGSAPQSQSGAQKANSKARPANASQAPQEFEDDSIPF